MTNVEKVIAANGNFALHREGVKAILLHEISGHEKPFTYFLFETLKAWTLRQFVNRNIK